MKSIKTVFGILLLACLGPIPIWAKGSGHAAIGYLVPQPGYKFTFPKDFGSHPGFKIEWWYITGHLAEKNGHRYGFEATFFRVATRPPGNAPPASDVNPDFRSSPLFLAHMALTDIAGHRFLHQERLNRAGWDASAAVGRLAVTNGNWSLKMTDLSTRRMHLEGSIRAEALFSLNLQPTKPLVEFGKNGVSRKGADPDASSYYLTFPRIKVSGTLTINGRSAAVSGQAWMDHEISSSQLSKGQVGWDWASIQFNDGWEIMSYRMRRADGSTDPYSTLTWINPSGKLTEFPASQFHWSVDATWRSAKSGARYPVEQTLRVKDPRTGKPVTITLKPVLNDQELGGNIPYWEGACDVIDKSGKSVGKAYLELTGYAGNMAKHLGR